MLLQGKPEVLRIVLSGIRELAVPWEHSEITNSRRGYKQSGHKPQQSITQTMRQPWKAFSGCQASSGGDWSCEHRRYEARNKEGTNGTNEEGTKARTKRVRRYEKRKSFTNKFKYFKRQKTKTPPFIMVVATNVERIIELTRLLNGWYPREISGRVGTSEFFTAAAGVLILKCSFEEVKVSLCFWILFLYNRYLPSKTLKWFPA